MPCGNMLRTLRDENWLKASSAQAMTSCKQSKQQSPQLGKTMHLCNSPLFSPHSAIIPTLSHHLLSMCCKNRAPHRHMHLLKSRCTVHHHALHATPPYQCPTKSNSIQAQLIMTSQASCKCSTYHPATCCIKGDMQAPKFRQLAAWPPRPPVSICYLLTWLPCHKHLHLNPCKEVFFALTTTTTRYTPPGACSWTAQAPSRHNQPPSRSSHECNPVRGCQKEQYTLTRVLLLNCFQPCETPSHPPHHLPQAATWPTPPPPLPFQTFRSPSKL